MSAEQMCTAETGADLQYGIQDEEQVSVAPANNTGPPLLQVWAEMLQAVLHVVHEGAMQSEDASQM